MDDGGNNNTGSRGARVLRLHVHLALRLFREVVLLTNRRKRG